MVPYKHVDFFQSYTLRLVRKIPLKLVPTAGLVVSGKQDAAEQTAFSSYIAAASHLRFCRTLQARQTLYDAAEMTLFPCQREKAGGKKFLPVLLRLTQL